MATIISSNKIEDINALKEILKRLIGTEIAPEGDIKFEIDGEEYVIQSHTGSEAHVIIDRS